MPRVKQTARKSVGKVPPGWRRVRGGGMVMIPKHRTVDEPCSSSSEKVVTSSEDDVLPSADEARTYSADEARTYSADEFVIPDEASSRPTARGVESRESLLKQAEEIAADMVEDRFAEVKEDIIGYLDSEIKHTKTRYAILKDLKEKVKKTE